MRFPTSRQRPVMMRRVAVTLGLSVALLWLAPAAGTRSAAVQTAAQAPGAASAASVELPNRDGSLKFAVLGDFGTGKREQYELGTQMAKVHERFRFELVITVGDNLYGSQRPKDFQTKFELPYQGVLEAGVKFYASLGNHDEREGQRYYKLFNMNGKLYYTFKAP